ncbi:DUF512 domain-containing protein [Atopobiaceae bacterium 24-176]
MSEQRQRADYGRQELPELGAWVASVEEGSPAWEAGLEPGMRVDAVNGAALDDIITWRWEADGASVDLDVTVVGDDGSEEACACTLVREPGQDWGLSFSDVLFDGIRTCRNACVFCFMSMLPEGMRDSLYLRDDDYRLSFLQGNFVTLTNVGDEDLERIVSHALSPMNVSIHAVSHEARRAMMGRNEARGLEVLERLCAEGIEVHAQVVLCPGLNDGEELVRTLDYVEKRPAITSLAIVPMGYTKNSPFSKSYSDDPEAAREVVGLVAPYQERARATLGITRFQLSDEFYVAARLDPPPAADYDGYPQYYDGIGMLRSFIDDTSRVVAELPAKVAAVARALEEGDLSLLLVCGEAAQEVYRDFLDRAGWAPRARVFAVRNDYFGGDVNVTGLIVAEDLLAQLPNALSGTVVVLPDLMLNFDSVTLDGMSADEVTDRLTARGADAFFIETLPESLVDGVFGHLLNG